MVSVASISLCPVCGKLIQFENAGINHKVCACGNVVVRNGDHLETLPIPVIHHPDNFIQPGTEGTWDGHKFSITGRFRIWFEGTTYNYWTMVLADGTVRYLAEGYGMFAVYERLDKASYLVSPELKKFTFHHPLPLLNHGEVQLSRINKGVRIDVEGSFYKPQGDTKITTYEAENDATSLEIFEFAEDVIEAYQCFPVEIDDLGLKYTREIVNPGRTFTCGHCKHDNVLKAYPYAQSWVCSNCGHRYSLKLSTLTEDEGKNKDKEAYFHIPIGTSLHFEGIDYEVIGLACKHEYYKEHNKWNEYTLYNPKYGFAFLNETEGHWMIVKESNDNPGVSSAHASYFIFHKEKFEVFLNYNFKIAYAEGCFPGNIFDEQNHTKATDFIAPPYIWSVERHPNKGFTWFYGTYLDRYEVSSQVDGRLPQKVGVAPGQPLFAGGLVNIIRSTLIVLLILIGVFFISGYTNQQKKIFDMEISIPDSLPAVSVVSEPFELKKWKSNLEFEISAPVDNSWFELGATLVNAKTGDEYSLEQGVEYYHGVSDGESWSEGSTSETAYLSSIPAGTYFLRLNGLRDGSIVPVLNFRTFKVSVWNDTTMARNFWITFFILLIAPVGMFLWQDRTEKSRWSVSPYSKYTS